MTIEIRPFEPDDMALLTVQADQAAELAVLGGAIAHGRAVVEQGPAFTAIERGIVIGCAGFTINHPGHATAWATLSALKPHQLLAISRAVRDVLAASRWRRIDAVVRADFEPAVVWAQWLGLHIEGAMECWGADGSDWLVMARIRR